MVLSDPLTRPETEQTLSTPYAAPSADGVEQLLTDVPRNQTLTVVEPD